ncbi:DUF1292 domain-containing protein [Clostridium intestinale]|uniref:DUF1292 domain-containing protein n=2 Tax=Clostridium intestinale TaxID=36845 RepID=U2NJ26_9CLOT|nr:DUF1292 domain-containing protein [Clostridium intestinale]ERK28871.1 hypothetical protein CINTURNW_3873 [Clostridium intestinale URNW]QLY80229.1 DUF1292 domain-containing protein [Clostridium intestinale]
MSEKRKMTFTDENGEKVDYTILDQLLLNSKEYVVMAPVGNEQNIEIYKMLFDAKLNESLEAVESESEISMVKKAAHIS